MLHRRTILFLLILLPVVLLAGCENLPGQGVVQDVAQAAVCESLDALGTAVAEVGEITAEANAADVKTLVGKLDGPVQAVRSAAERVDNAELNALFSSYDNLSARVAELPDDAAMDQAATEVESAVTDLQAALDSASASLGCGE
jgi:hypothetical protein